MKFDRVERPPKREAFGANHYDSRAALKVADRLSAEGVDLAVEYHFDLQVGAILLDKFSQAGSPVIAIKHVVVDRSNISDYYPEK